MTSGNSASERRPETLSEVFRRRLDELNAQGLSRDARVVDSLPDGRCWIAGRQLNNFGSNDYLGLAHDSRVTAAFAEAAQRQAGSGASSLVTGRSSLHAELEQRLAEFEDCDAALLFPSGYAANLGTVQALVTRHDLILSERDNHASLIDAVRSSAAEVVIFDRDRLETVREALHRRRAEFEQVWLVVDGVYSMDGTVAPLRELSDIADEFAASIVVDEAHGTGVLGNHGRGASEHCGVSEHRDAKSARFVRVGTLSKSLGALGGFVVGDQPVIDWLRNRARPQFFSTSLPPAICAAALTALEIVQNEPERRHRLSDLNRMARRTACDLGLRVVGDGPAPIIPILLEDPHIAVSVSVALQEAGWFVPAMRPPTVPGGTSRLRLTLSAVHSEHDVQAVLRATAELARDGD